MAFDRNDPADLLALKNEVNDDPLGMGYDPPAGTQPVLDLLNIPANNLSPADGDSPVIANVLLKVIFGESISAQDQFKLQLLFEASSDLDADLSEYRALITALSNPLGIALAAALIRALSRAEVLFSDVDVNGTTELITISRNDWIAARDS